MRKNRTLFLLKLTRILFFVNALIWLVFGLFGIVLAMKGAGNWRAILSALLFVTRQRLSSIEV